MLLPITITAAAAAALLHIWLSLRVSQVRMKSRIELGDGGNEILQRRMRAHANYVENIFFFLFLLLLLEMAGVWSLGLWTAVILFILARVLHAFGMDRKAPNPLRMVGTIASLAVIAALAIWGVTLTYAGQDSRIGPRMESPAVKG